MEITLIGIFLEGLLSFLSPCVLPLVPLYMSYLVGEDKIIKEDGSIVYKKAKVFISTFSFVLGVSLTFVILAFSVDKIAAYLDSYQEIIYLISGTLLIIFGLHETGLIHLDVLNKEYKLKINLHLEKMNLLKAFLLGFVFSIGWSPCIGPLLANALLLASSEPSGYLYIVAYGLGLLIPFLFCGLLTSTILNFLKNKKHLFRYTMVMAGLIMICFGGYMIYHGSKEIIVIKKASDNNSTLFGHYFKDLDGKQICLGDYQDKYIVVNFSATWCTYCQMEMEDYLKFAKDYQDEVLCVYCMNTNSDSSFETIKEYCENKGIDIPVLVDDGYFNYLCGIESYPTLLVFGQDEKCYGGYAGMLIYENMEYILTESIDRYNSNYE